MPLRMCLLMSVIEETHSEPLSKLSLNLILILTVKITLILKQSFGEVRISTSVQPLYTKVPSLSKLKLKVVVMSVIKSQTLSLSLSSPVSTSDSSQQPPVL